MKTIEPITYKRLSSTETDRDRIMALIRSPGMVAAIIGLLISRGSIAGCMSPLGMAWCAAVSSLPCGFLVFIGCAVGFCFSNMGFMRLKYIAAVGIFGLIHRYCGTKISENRGYAAAAMCGANILCSAIAVCIRGFLYYDMAIALFECATLWAVSIIFSKCEPPLRRRGQIITEEESIAVAIMAGSAVAGLQGINIFGIKPANVLSMYIILFTAFKGGIGISGAVGAALGIISAMSQGDAPALTGVYAFVGLTAGIMNMFGKGGVLAAAICANAVFSAYYSSSVIVLINIFEIIIAGIGFYLTPENLLKYIEKYSIKSPAYNPAEGRELHRRIKTSEAFDGIRHALAGMSRAFSSKAEKPDQREKIAVICERTASRVCGRCSLSRYCRSRNAKNTSTMFSSITELMVRGRPEEIPAAVSGRCVRSEQLASVATELYNVYRRENIIERRAEEYTACAVRQWHKLMDRAEALGHTAENSVPECDGFGERIVRALAAKGTQNPVCNVSRNGLGLYEVSVKTPQAVMFDLSDPIENILGRRMTVRSEKKTDNGYITVLCEDTTFDYDIAIVTMDKPDTDISGDSGRYFVTGEGVLYCCISDGMGSGREAAGESGTVLDIFRDLTEGGFSLPDTAQIINTGLINRTGGDRCATLDCLSINLYNGKVSMLKAGGVATVVKTEDDTAVFRTPSMPLGILENADIQESYFAVSDETYFVMMTDGVPDNSGDRSYGEDFIKNIVSAGGDISAKEMAENVIMSAITTGRPKDDMMVMAVRIFPKTGI